MVIHSSTGLVPAHSTSEFTVSAQPGKPEITGMTSRSLTAGQPLTLMGHGLDQIQSVYIGTVNITNIQHSGTETIRLTVSQMVQPGQSQK